MLHSTLRHTVFVHRFVEAVTWQPLRQALAPRPMTRNALRATAFFKIPPNQVFEVGSQVEL